MVYVRFGKIENPKFTRVYEGLVIDNEIQLLMPKTSHGGARDILEELGFGDVEIFLVSGIPVDSDDRDRRYTKATKVIHKLEYDASSEKILIPKTPVVVEEEIDVLERYNVTDDTPYGKRIGYCFKEFGRLMKKAIQDTREEGRVEQTNKPKGIRGYN